MMLHLPSDVQLDALREVANVGCGSAASALSRLVGGERVSIEVPRALVVDVDDLSHLSAPAHRVVVATVDILGQLAGRLVVLIDRGDAVRLCEMLLGEPPVEPLGEAERSAVCEVANILGSACLSAIGRLTRLSLLPSVPTVDEDEAEDVMAELIHRSNPAAGVAVVLETRFLASAALPFTGQLLLLPHPASLERLLDQLGV